MRVGSDQAGAGERAAGLRMRRRALHGPYKGEAGQDEQPTGAVFLVLQSSGQSDARQKAQEGTGQTLYPHQSIRPRFPHLLQNNCKIKLSFSVIHKILRYILKIV